MNMLIEELSFESEMDHDAMTQVSGGRLPQQIMDFIAYVDDYTHGNGYRSGDALVHFPGRN